MITRIGTNAPSGVKTRADTLEVSASPKRILIQGWSDGVGLITSELYGDEAKALIVAVSAITDQEDMMDHKTPGQKAYEEDCKRTSHYPFGLYQKRPDWQALPEYAKLSWERNPTPREYNLMDIREPKETKEASK